MKAAGKTYEPVTYDGAGHGFMRAGKPPTPTSQQKSPRRSLEALEIPPRPLILSNALPNFSNAPRFFLENSRPLGAALPVGGAPFQF